MTHQDIRLHSIASNAAAVGLGGKMARSFMCPSTFLNRQATIKAPGALNRFRWQVSRDGDHANQYGFITGIALYPNAVKRFGVDKYKLDDLCAEELKWHLVGPVTSTEAIFRRLQSEIWPLVVKRFVAIPATTKTLSRELKIDFL